MMGQTFWGPRSVDVPQVSGSQGAADAGKVSTLLPLASLHGPLPPLIVGKVPHVDPTAGKSFSPSIFLGLRFCLVLLKVS